MTNHLILGLLFCIYGNQCKGNIYPIIFNLLGLLFLLMAISESQLYGGIWEAITS